MCISRTFLASFFALLSIAAYASADQVDNPRFAAWNKFAVGSSETLDGSVSNSGFQMDFEVQFSLADKADDHLDLNVTSTVSVMGQEHSSTHQETVAAKMDAKNVQELPDESVTAAGKTFDCKVFQVPDASNQQTTMKIWSSDQVPGGLVKMEAASPRGNATITYLLKSYEAK
ncbi:MAG: hypothetical protein ABSF29_06525 [Tepidisphaeraceae bacterium]|jgi:hypothetical protein